MFSCDEKLDELYWDLNIFEEVKTMLPTPNPIALQLGPLTIRWYGVLMSTALAVGVYFAYKEAEKQKIDPEHILNLAIMVAPLCFVGARLYYVMFQWPYYAAHPSEIPAVWHGGLAIHGAIITGIVAGYFFVKHYKLSFWQMADIVAPSLILGQAIGRWGNYFNQEAYGYPTNLPWAMYINGAYRHPTFLYESLWDFGVFLLLIYIRRKGFIKRGEVFLLYLATYSIGRFVVEGFRTDSLMLGPLRAAQVVSIIAALCAAAIVFYRRKKCLR